MCLDAQEDVHGLGAPTSRTVPGPSRRRRCFAGAAALVLILISFAGKLVRAHGCVVCRVCVSCPCLRVWLVFPCACLERVLCVTSRQGCAGLDWIGLDGLLSERGRCSGGRLVLRSHGTVSLIHILSSVVFLGPVLPFAPCSFFRVLFLFSPPLPSPPLFHILGLVSYFFVGYPSAQEEGT